jgi:hypothetical protein
MERDRDLSPLKLRDRRGLPTAPTSTRDAQHPSKSGSLDDPRQGPLTDRNRQGRHPAKRESPKTRLLSRPLGGSEARARHGIGLTWR